MTNHVTFFEISSPATLPPSALRGFYASLGLAGAPHPEDPNFWFIAPGDGSVPGFVYPGGAGFDTDTYAVIYVEVPDVDAAVEEACHCGGRVLTAPHQHGPVRAAHLADPAGNRIGVFSGSALG